MQTWFRQERLQRRIFLKGAAVGLATAGTTWTSSTVASDVNRGKIAGDAEGDVYRIAIKLKTPKSGKDKRVSEPLDEITCSMFIPQGLRVIRGATFNAFYEPTVEQKHWRAAASCWGFAHIGTNLFRVRNDELRTTVLRALAKLAQVSEHPEVKHIPLCFHGMSIGGGLSSRLVEALPERTIAAAPVCLEVGPRDEASRRVPMVTIFGERDGRQMEILSAKLPAARADSARWAIAPQWGRKHEWHRASNMVVAFYDRVIRLRYPPEADPVAGPVTLIDCGEQRGWLADRSTWRTSAPKVFPFDQYPGDRSETCWLPDGYVAAVWRSFVSCQSPLRITSPTGMGDGVPFQSCSANKPIDLTLDLRGDLDCRQIELYDGLRRLTVLKGTPTSATLPGLDTGIYALIAEAVLADGTRIVSPPNTIVVR